MMGRKNLRKQHSDNRDGYEGIKLKGIPRENKPRKTNEML
jgi:hypothetical protein